MQGWSGNILKYGSYWQQKTEEMQCFSNQFFKNSTESITVFWITAIKIS